MRYARVSLFLLLFISGCTSFHIRHGDCEATYNSIFEDTNIKSVSACGVDAEVIENSANTVIVEKIIDKYLK